MAVRVACATGNLTAAATWGTTNATASLLSTSTGTTTLTASNQNSAAFTPGAITLDGIAVRVAFRGSTASPTNNLILTLRNSSDAVDVASATIPVSYLPNTTSGANQELQPGWIFWKIGSTTLLAGKNYILQARLDSTSTSVSLYTNGTAANWQRITRLTTTGAPAAGDELYVLEEWTAGAQTPLTVTMDSTATTDYGTGTFNLGQPALVIGKNCVFAYGTAGSTNYVYKVSGAIFVQPYGTFRMGNAGTPMPRTSTATLTLDTTAAASDVIHVGALGTFEACGQSRTSGKDQWSALMTADAAAGATSLTIDTDTGWLNGDEIAIGTTSSGINTDSELISLNADAGANSLSLGSGLAVAKNGTNGLQAAIILMKRNVLIDVVTSYGEFTVAATASAVTISWTQIIRARGRYNVGTFRYCTFRSTGVSSIPIASLVSGPALACDVRYCGFYTSSSQLVIIESTASTASIQDTIFIGDANANLISINANAAVLTNVRVHGGNAAISVAPPAGNVDFSNITVLGASSGFNYSLNRISGGTLSNIVTRLCTLGISLEATLSMTDVTLDGCEGSASGATATGIYLSGAAEEGRANVRLVDCRTATLPQGAATPQKYGIRIDLINGVTTVRDVGHRFGGSHGGVTYDANERDVQIGQVGGTTSAYARLIFENALSPNAALSDDGAFDWAHLTADSAMVSLRHGADSVEQAWVRFGARRTDASVFHTAAPSEAVYPTSTAPSYCHSGSKFIALTAGASCTVGVWVRRSSTGVTPRLVVAENNALGITADTVLATISVGADTWEQLTGTIGPVDDDGCAEVWVEGACNPGPVFYVDDWTVA